MNSLKTLFIALLLATGAGAAYMLINGSPPVTPGSTDAWTALPGAPPAGGPSVSLGAPAVSFATDQPRSQTPAFSDAPAPPAVSPPADPPSVTPGITPAPAASSLALPSNAPSNTAAPYVKIPRADDPAPSPQGLRPQFVSFMKAAVEKLNAGDWIEVLDRLSAWYGDPRLSAEESQQVTDLLDQVAGSVIYSSQSILEPPYSVKTGDTLESIGRTYNVPGELLAKINGIRDPNDLAPGREIKIIRGPFDAVVHLDRFELTLKLQNRYAGRFPIGVGRDPKQIEGAYTVKEKSLNPTYYGPDGSIDADDPRNPLGERMIGLGNQLFIHGTDDPRHVGAATARGTICLAERDVEELYDILSIGSKVVIRR